MIEKNAKIQNYIYNSPKEPRDDLKNSGLIEEKKKKAIVSIYSLLSGNGAHPYIARTRSSKAFKRYRIHLWQFVMLRLK